MATKAELEAAMRRLIDAIEQVIATHGIYGGSDSGGIGICDCAVCREAREAVTMARVELTDIGRDGS